MALLIGVLALAGQWIAYSASSDVLEASVRAREIDKINTISNVVKGMLVEQENNVRLIARLMATDSSLGKSVTLNGPERLASLKPAMDQVFALGRLQTFEVAGPDEVVLYRAHAPQRYGDKAVGWGVAEALDGKGITTTVRVKEGVVIEAIEPLALGGKVVGTVTAGILLNRKLVDELSQQVGAYLALLGRKGALTAATGGAMDSFDLRGVAEAFEKKIPVYRFDPEARQTSVYLPLVIVDEAYVVLARLDSAEAYGLIESGNRRSAYVAALILVVSLVVGFLVLHWALWPLRQLRQRAEKTALELTGESISASGRDEVTSVVKVLDTLTDRLVQRNRDLAQAKVLADAASLAKSQFLSAMSHEIRTPLNGVLGMAELLRDTPLSRDQVRFVGAIESAGRVLHGLLSDILDLAKIEEGQVKLEQIDFDPRQVSMDLSSVFSEMASMRSITLKTDVSELHCVWASGDPTRFRQVLSNLLSNAMKFTPRGEIRLRGESIAAPNTGDKRSWCRFSVEDTGIGISPEALGKLFNRFEQADVSTTRHFGGSGLGLAICKHLVELMGGQIHAQSTEGVGSRFWFDLPLESPLTPNAPPPLSANTVQLAGMKILVAEDNAINQLVVKTLLTRLGANLTLVENGELAVQEVKQTPFDLVFMDCQMPVMDGYEATRQIRLWEQTRPDVQALPIVALTANALAGDREACLAAGMTDYVTKPVTSAALAQALERNRPKVLLGESAQSTPKAGSPKEPEAAVYDPSVLGDLPMVLDGSDPGFADEMLDLFTADAHKTLDAIDRATHEADIPTLTRLVHTLKSSAAQVGALALSAQASHQEAQLREGKMGQPDWRDRLKGALADFERVVAGHRRGQ